MIFGGVIPNVVDIMSVLTHLIYPFITFFSAAFGLAIGYWGGKRLIAY